MIDVLGDKILSVDSKPDVVDIVVIGAGIVGCAVAYELAKRGASVRVLDDRPVGMGATQASAGVLAPHIEAREKGSLLQLAVRSLEIYDSFIAAVRSASAAEVTYCRTGTLDVALGGEAMSRLESAAKTLTAQGVVAKLLNAGAVREAEPHVTTRAVGGLLIPAHGFVAAHELTKALALAAERHGALFEEPTRARRVSQGADGLTVETNRHTFAAKGVVLAAGSWAGQIEVADLTRRVPIRPVRGQLLHLAWTGPTLRRVVWGERCYLVPWDDGTLLVGATVEEVGFDERTTVAGVRDLIDWASELVPAVQVACLTSARAGLRPASVDGIPVIGPSSVLPGLMYATGHYRNGVLLAPLTAALVADAMLDGRIDPIMELTSPRRFPDL